MNKFNSFEKVFAMLAIIWITIFILSKLGEAAGFILVMFSDLLS